MTCMTALKSEIKWRGQSNSYSLMFQNMVIQNFDKNKHLRILSFGGVIFTLIQSNTLKYTCPKQKPCGQVQKCKTYANKLPCSYCTHICILHTCTQCIAHDSSLDRWTALNQESAFQLSTVSSSQCPALNVGPWKRPSHVTKAELATGWESSLVNYHQTRKAATLRVHKSCDCLWLSALHVQS